MLVNPTDGPYCIPSPAIARRTNLPIALRRIAVELLEMTWPQVAALSRDTPVVVPIAALEQHGRHMPLFTDSLLLGEVMHRIKEPLKERVLFTPLMWLGNSHHHLDFPGTMSASPRVYLDLLIDLAENLIAHGFRRIVLLNGHGGNIVPAQQALFELRQKTRQRADLLLLSTTYWTAGTRTGPIDPSLKQTQMGHACEFETSMMLRIRPELVGDYHGAIDVPWGRAFAPASRAWITKDRTVPGHIGYPQHASAEKGEILFRAFTADVVALLERVIAWDGAEWDA
jgi:creatinine amidohydrolase